MVEEEVLPLAAAFLDLLGQSTFVLVREQGKTSDIAQIALQDGRFSIVGMHGSFPVSLRGLRKIRRYV